MAIASQTQRECVIKLKIVHKGLIYLCLPLVAQGYFAYQLFDLINQVEKSVEKQAIHIRMSREMSFTIIQFCRTLSAIGTNARFGSTKGLMPAAEYRKLMDDHLARLDKDIKITSADYQQVYNQSRKLIDSQYSLLQLIETGGEESALDTINRLALTKSVISNAQAAGMVIYRAWGSEEELLAKEREHEAESREKIKSLIWFASIFDLTLALALIATFITNITKRINLLVKNATVLPSSKELPYTVKGGDEIAYLDEAMHKASQELQEAAGYRRSLIEMMAHDLRSPLTAIGIAFDVMLKSSTAGSVSVPDSKIRYLRQSLKQTTTLMEDLLALDRMEATQLELELDLVSAKQIVEDSCELLSAQAQQKSLTIKTNIENLDVIVDRNRIVQVLSNLISNAIRYSPDNSTILVKVSKRQNHAHFSVSDQGPGIDIDLQDHIFEKYYQVKNSQKAANGIGYGLGLAISKQIITRHGGEIGVDSMPAKGSDFWFDIPLDKADDDD